MMVALLTWLGTFVPGLSSLLSLLAKFGLQFYDAKLAAEGSHEALVAGLAAKQSDLAAQEATLSQQQKVLTVGRWYEPEHLLGYILVLWLGKVILWDNVIGSLVGYAPVWLFYTHSLKPSTESAVEVILEFWVGGRFLLTGLRTLISGWKL